MMLAAIQACSTQPGPELALELPFVATLIVVGVIDVQRRIVPNRIVAPAAAWGLAGGVVIRPDDIQELVVAGAAAFLCLLLPALAHPAGMGMGDVKLAGVMGLYLGAAVAPALLVAFLAGGAAGLVLIARRGLDARRATIPFAPCLALGGIVGLLAAGS